jgi:hypothetical protein
MVGDALGVEPHGHALHVPAVVRELARRELVLARFNRVGVPQPQLRAADLRELDSHRRGAELGGLVKDEGVAVC